MKIKLITIFFSLLILSSCLTAQEKINTDLSIIVISSDHYVGKNILNFAILDNNGNQITNKLENLTKSEKYNFLESLAEDSFKEIFEDKRINSATIKIEKPDAIKNAKSVGIEVFKTRKDYEGS